MQELYQESRLHQTIQQVALISYIQESILMSPVFKKIPAALQMNLSERMYGLKGSNMNVSKVEIDSYDKKKKLPSHLNKALKDICIR
jgi:hypothetical protein